MRPWLSAEQLAEQYRRMHVVLVPSTATATWVEQFGRVAIEAQAAGAVVAGYSSGTLPEVAGPHAVLRDPGDVTGLAGAVRSVLAHPDDWRSRRTAGLAWAAHHTWDEVARRQIDLYASVAAGERTVIQLPRSRRARSSARCRLRRSRRDPLPCRWSGRARCSTGASVDRLIC
jgi:glycosyltransferase involved in cell wall biosynthesis